ncbi:MAG: type 11 methyltransferase [Parcubacteria group bacterium Gr01-1014_72]|nr:MAG: type 11 methyltransferase [Parcubacteria group bacterium Gr01-1014_72]
MDISIYHGIAAIERNNWWYKARRDVISSLLKSFNKDGSTTGKRVLSVGCGVGGEIVFLKKYGEVFGIDSNKTAIDFCVTAGLSKEVRCADAEHLPFSDNSFDTLFVLDVMEHVNNDDAAMKEIYRVLKIGGTLVLTVPAFQVLWTRSDERSHHHRRYTKRQVVSMVRKNNFIILKASYFNTLLFVPIAMIKLLTRVYEPKKMVGKEVNTPIPFVNALLYRIFRLEATLLKWVNFPFGISVIAIGVKNNSK